MTNDKNNKSFDWQKEYGSDLEIAELHFAKRVASGGATRDDAVEYLVCRGWDLDKAKKALGIK